MKEALLIIENGMLRKDEQEIFRHFNLTIHQSEMLGMLFGHILEQKTFLRLLKGQDRFDSGRIFFNHEKVGLKTAGIFQRHVTVIDRNSKLIDSLSIAANVFLFAPGTGKYSVNEKRFFVQMRKLAKTFEVVLPLEQPVTSLTTAERIKIELLKAHAEGKKLVVLEGVIGNLLTDDAQDVYLLISKLKQTGMTFLILESVEDLALDQLDRLAVVRNGKVQWIFAAGEISRQQIYAALLGETRIRTPPERVNMKFPAAEERRSALEFRGVCTEVLHDIHFSVNRGDIFRVCFWDEPSFNHFVDILKGNRKPSSGEILVADRPYAIQHSHRSVDRGLCFVEESPYETMMIHGMTVLDHICLPLSKKVSGIWSRRRFIHHLRKQINDLLGGDFAGVFPHKLSSVQQLRIAYLKWLIYAPSVVICVKPFAELNFHLRRATEEMMNMLSGRGIAVVILTMNLAESSHHEITTLHVRNGEVLDCGDVESYLYGEATKAGESPEGSWINPKQ